MRQLTVLLIDDDDCEQRLFEAYCQQFTGFEVHLGHAPTLETALSAMQTENPDIVFLDHRIAPHTSCVETVPILRNAGFAGPIVVISASPKWEVLDRLDALDEAPTVLDKLSLNAKIFRETLTKCLNSLEHRSDRPNTQALA